MGCEITKPNNGEPIINAFGFDSGVKTINLEYGKPPPTCIYEFELHTSEDNGVTLTPYKLEDIKIKDSSLTVPTSAAMNKEVWLKVVSGPYEVT
jgi:hypothetical protein